MPKRAREKRQTAPAVQSLAPEVIAKRTKRHLDELERSNYVEATLVVEDDEAGGAGANRRGGRQLISDKRNLTIPGTSPAATKKKSTMNVRTALLYQKSLAKHIEDSGIASLTPDVPTYLTAATIPPTYPARVICTVCGYWGAYKCRRCAMPYCDLNCERVHEETRCERRVL